MRYKPIELERMLSAFQSGMPLEKIKIKRRTLYGLALKILSLSEQQPDIWTPAKVKEYTKRERRKHRGNIRGQKRRYKMRQRGLNVELKNDEGKPSFFSFLNEINRPKFGEYLCKLLSAYKGLKQTFASEHEIHPSQLSRYLSGKSVPTRDFFRKLADKSCLSYEDFISQFKK